MTLKELYKHKLSFLQISISEEKISDFLASKQVDENEEVSKDVSKEKDTLFLELILSLLVAPNISEDNFSISYDRNYILQWYAIECERLGVKNLLKESEKPKVKDKSYLA